MSARFWISFVVANLIGGFFLWLVAKELPLDQVQLQLKQAGAAQLITWSLVFIAVYAVCHWARVVRWHTLIQPLDAQLEAKQVHKVCLVGLTAIFLLPLRLGELVRPYLLAKKTDRVSSSALLGTAVVERVVDGLMMTALLFITLATYRGDKATSFAMTTGIISAGVFVGALTFCLLALWRLEWTLDLVHKIFGVVSEGLANKLAGLLRDFILGFRVLVQGKSLGRFLVQTTLYWLTNALSMWLLARFGFGLEVSLWDMTTVLALLVIGIMIPAGPAMAGNFEFFMTRAMALFVALDQVEISARAAAFAATVHILQFIVIALPGFIVMWLDPSTRHLIALSEQANSALDQDGAAQPE